jgi:beta-galactosidase
MEGPLVARGKVLLQACNTDWKLWNFQGEDVKVARMARCEHEAKPAGAALVSVPVGRGRLILCTIPCSSSIPKREALGRALLVNLGLTLPPESKSPQALNEDGQLVQALWCGVFPVTSATEGPAASFVRPDMGASFRKGASVAPGVEWKPMSALGTLFDLRRLGVSGPGENVVSYFSFWVFSRVALDNLLADPHLPKVNLEITSSDAVEAWLNGRSVLRTEAGGKAARSSSLPMQAGWNHFLIKDFHNLDSWKLSAALESNHPGYFDDLSSALEKPGEE